MSARTFAPQRKRAEAHTAENNAACTCGEKAGQDRHQDLSPHCRRDDHSRCFGLHSSTGFHWWCACDCHPEPDVTEVPSLASLSAVQRALSTYRAARKARVIPPGSAAS